MKTTKGHNGGSLHRIVRRRGVRGRMKRGWKKPLPLGPPTRRRRRDRADDVWVEIFLPPVCKDDVMVCKRLNISNGRDMEEWQWWQEQYNWLKGVKPPNVKVSDPATPK